MSKVAVIVDAGYLLCEGGLVLAKRRVGRSDVDVDPEKAVKVLGDVAFKASEGCALLRVYWYDATPKSGKSGSQTYIALANDVKFRAGTLVTSDRGPSRQKGVDTLIVTDIIELARNRSASDFLLVTGDEDLRIGVQVAQSMGARVHL